MNKEKKITLLALLNNFYDEETFALLIKEFYNSDLDISLTAIKSSSSLGNEIAVPHLYKIIEKGVLQQKIEAIKTLSKIKAPSSIIRLIQYFNLFKQKEVRIEILKTINSISPLNEKIGELNQSILLSSDYDDDFRETALLGLIKTDRLEFVEKYVKSSSPEIQKTIFYEVLQSGNDKVHVFISKFKELSKEFSPDTLGCYLCAYILKVLTGKSFVIDSLKRAENETIISFIKTLSEFKGMIEQPKEILRILLILKYISPEIEAVTGDFVEKVISEVRKRMPNLLSYFILMVSTHIETVFGKIKKQYFSIKGIKEKNTLLIILLAQIVEKYASPKLLNKIQNYFQTTGIYKSEKIIKELDNALKDAPEEDKNKLKVCISLFNIKNPKARISVSSNLSYINLSRPNLIRRLNRLIRISGKLNIRKTTKKIIEILEFSRTEKIPFIEETCIVSLCQFNQKSIIDESKKYFISPKENPVTFSGFIRGVRYISPKIMFHPVSSVLITNAYPEHMQDLIIETLESWDLSGVKNTTTILIKVLKLITLNKTNKIRIGDIIAKHSTPQDLQSLLELTGNQEAEIKITAIKALLSLAKKHLTVPKDILINKLYTLMDDKNNTVMTQALLTLIELGDDYALTVLKDQLDSSKDVYNTEILSDLENKISHKILSAVLNLLQSTNSKTHEVLRRVLHNISQTELSEEIRHNLIHNLIDTESKNKNVKLEEEKSTELMEHAKTEFKLKRESSQNLTILFVDIVDYTKRTSSSDTSTLLNLIKSFENTVIPQITKYQGNIVKKMGDGILSTFKHPLNAVIATLAIRNKVLKENEFKVEKEKLFIRMGVNTGLIIKSKGDIYGDAVNIASRMETAANPGEILLTSSTYNEIKNHIRCIPLGNIQVKGKKDAIMAYTAEELISEFESEGENGKKAEEKTDEDKFAEISKNETIIKTNYIVPDIDHKEILNKVKDIFIDLTGALEEIARDYEEENNIKEFLQKKWDEFVESVNTSNLLKK